MKLIARIVLAVTTAALVVALPAIPAFAAGTVNLYNDPGHTVGPRQVFARGDTMYASATGLNAGHSYQFEVLNTSAASVHVSGCTTGTTSAADSYAIQPADPLSTASVWKYNLYEFTSANCTTGKTTPGHVDVNVVALTAYSDSGLTIPQSSFAPGSSVYTVLQGLTKGVKDWSVTWVRPDSTPACANTGGGDRPDADAVGKLPSGAGAFLQYPPNTGGAAWNIQNNYEIRPCPATTAGTWRLKLSKDTKKTVTLAAFTVTASDAPPPAPSLVSPLDNALTGDATPALDWSDVTDPDAGDTVTYDVQADNGGCSFASPEINATGLSTSDFTPGSSLPDGTYCWRARAVDNHAMAGAYSITRDLTIDTAGPPSPVLDSTPADPSGSSSASFGFHDTEAGATFQCDLDGSGYSACSSSKNYSGLSEAPHTFSVKAQDGTGNLSSATSYTWTVDTTGPPAPVLDSTPANPSGSGTASFGFHDADGGVTFQCDLDGLGYSACTSPMTYPFSLADGPHTFSVRALDGAGNPSSVTSFAWTVDTGAPPTPVIDTHPANPSNSSSASFTFHDSEAGASFVCDLDGGGYSACAGPANYAGLSEASHTFSVKAKDATGNLSGAATFTWTVDVTGPSVPVLDSTPTNPSTSASASFAFHDADGGVTFECKIDAGAFAACTSPKPYAALADAIHTFSVRAKDGVGNLSGAATFVWAVDTTAPPAPILDSTPPALSNSSSASFTFHDGDAGATFLCDLDGAGYTPCSSPKNYFGLVDAHTFSVKAKDVAGNLSPATSFVWTVDILPPPAPTLDSTPGSPSGSSSATFAFHDTEAGATFLCDRDGGGYATCSSPKNYAGLSEASHTFSVKATDAAGNLSSATSFTWTVDTTPPPAPVFDSTPTALSNSSSATFAFHDTEAGTTFLCDLDGGGYSACTSPKGNAGLSEGGHAFSVKARDAAGNNSSATSFAWTVDTIAPPTPLIDTHPEDPSDSSSASFAFHDTEGGATFRCDLDGGGYSACTGPTNYSGLSGGPHLFSVKAQDGAGNLSGAATYDWEVDLTGPSVPVLDSTPANPSASDSASFAFHDVDAGVTFECDLDGGGFAACTSPQDYSSLSDGIHTFSVRAKDGVGNLSGAATFAWAVDTASPPDPVLDFTPPSLSNSSSASFGFHDGEAGATFLCDLDGGGYSACASPKNYAGLNGAHTFSVQATDAAGNLSGATTYSWTVDVTSPPAPVLDTTPSNPTSSTTAAFGFHDTDGGATFLCDLDGVGFAACSDPKSYPFVLVDGLHSFSVMAVDGSANASTVTAYSWIVDTTADVTPPPAPVLDSTPTDPSGSSGSFAFHDTELGATFRCQIDGGGYAACSSAQDYTSLSDGSHTFDVKARDAATNLSGPTSFTWTVDGTGPVITVAYPTAGKVFARFQRVRAKWSCQDATGVATCTGPTGYLPTGALGGHSVVIHATDTLGNQRSRTVRFTVMIACRMTPTISVRLHQTVINGTAGDDVIRAIRPVAYHISTGAGNDVVCSGNFADVIATGFGSDVVVSQGGRDRISTGGGADYVDAGLGGDTVDGGLGNDLLQGKKGRDTLTGGLGADILKGQFGNDTLHGRDGVRANDSLNGGPGRDTCDADRGDVRISC
jgi:hypothetical protein